MHLKRWQIQLIKLLLKCPQESNTEKRKRPRPAASQKGSLHSVFWHQSWVCEVTGPLSPSSNVVTSDNSPFSALREQKVFSML